jgi:hypothetical protein
MTELIIDDFKLGLDVRRSILTAPAGSLQTLDNVIINAGGEIEKRAAFIVIANLPPGQTHGLIGLNKQIHIFGTAAPPTIDQGTSPYPITYHQLAVDTGKTLAKILDVDGFQQKYMVAGQNTDGSITNWWDGALANVGTSTGPGTFFRQYQQKMYRTSGPYLAFAGVGDPSMNDPNNTTSPGAGFIDMSSIDSEAQIVNSLEIYYQQVAVFSRLVCLLWKLDPDPAQNDFMQLVRIGAVAPQSVAQFGTGDVLFMSDSGVRSLRAINASLAAAVNDVGSPIDKLIQAEIANNTAAAMEAVAVVTPITGRYILAIGNTAYVLSYFPSAKISAWSTWSLPFNVDYLSTVENRTIIRAGDTLYMYGGPTGDVYDNTLATVVTPMMAADTPTLWKKPIAIDLMCQGVWQLSAGMLANSPNARELVGTFNGETYSLQTIPYAGFGTHIGLTLTTSDPSAALLGSITVNFQKANVKGFQG